jgi:serine/threonine protein kinase
LSEALDFLHRQGLTHRDIKPSNVIFVDGQPKLTDVGLVTELRPPEEVTTWAGSPGYMPPAPEPPGTVQADIYALGMLLYVISTGREPAYFPELSTTLVQSGPASNFAHLHPIILKACQPDCAKRYKSTAEMRADLLQVEQDVKRSA